MRWIVQNANALEIWLAAGCTLGIYSILYKENKAFRFFEHLYIGLASGWAIFMGWSTVLYPYWWSRIFVEGRWWWFFTVPLGLLLYTMYTKKYAWMSRVTLGLMMGMNAGQQFQIFSGLYYKQVSSTFKPVVPHPAVGIYKAVSVAGAINNLVFMVIIACVMTYFFFSFEQKHPAVRRISSTGRYLLMVAFGAIFGATIMARMALFISRVDYLVHTWLGMYIRYLKPK